MQATLSQRSSALAWDETIWLRNAFYDLLLFAFPWVPFLGAVIYGFAWQEDFSYGRNPLIFKDVVLFLLALNFAHRNSTYLVTYGDRQVFLSRSGGIGRLLWNNMLLGAALLIGWKKSKPVNAWVL